LETQITDSRGLRLDDESHDRDARQRRTIFRNVIRRRNLPTTE